MKLSTTDLDPSPSAVPATATIGSAWQAAAHGAVCSRRIEGFPFVPIDSESYVVRGHPARLQQLRSPVAPDPQTTP